MSQPAKAKKILINPGSLVNGNITYYDFTVQSTNYLKEGY